MSQYLVTGGAGFIGSHLIDRLLNDGHDVRVLDDLSSGSRENLDPHAELVVGSVTDRGLMRQMFEGCDGCFHLAAIASVTKCNDDWAGSHAVNVMGAIHVFEAAVAQGKVPVVYASSAAVFGGADILPLTETSPTRPLSAYGADKYGCELQARAGHVVHGLTSTGLRFFNVYGSRQDPASPYSGVISIFAERLRSGREIIVHGDGRQTRDFIAVADAVETLVRSMDQPGQGARVFNVCTGHRTSLLDLVEILGETLGMAPDISFVPARAGDIRDSAGSPALLESELGFMPQIGLRDGLRRMLSEA